MKAIHLKMVNSTQKYLLENLESLIKQHDGEENFLCSTDRQTAGVGRFGKHWDHFNHSLAFSLSLRPNKTATLTSLEITTLLIDFFQERFSLSTPFPPELYLKWPNDLLNERREKCAGILTNYYRQNLFVVGIGLNLFEMNDDKPSENYFTPHNFILKEELFKTLNPTQFKETLPLEICQFILGHRKSPQTTIADWQKHCIHLNQEVTIVDDHLQTTGIFKGISTAGEALVADSVVQTGSLIFRPKNIGT